MDESTPKSAAAEAPEVEVAGTENVNVDTAKLADALSKAREGLRAANPTCFVEQPEQCQAVREVDDQLAAVERALRGPAARQPELGAEELPEGAYIEGVSDAGNGE